MIRKLLNLYWQYRRNRQTQRVLHGLSDHTLRDIGMRRDQIEDYIFFRR
jgi:uncharacterized protein YjiS (DUF1127 family)